MMAARADAPGPWDVEAANSVDLVETLAEAAHEGWMEGKRAAGVTSRKAAWGEEFMVPYGYLSEQAKDLDRQAVQSMLDAIKRAGYSLMRNHVGRG